MQIIGLNIGSAHSRLASQQEASQENWFNLLKTASRSWQNFGIGGACLFTLHSLYWVDWIFTRAWKKSMLVLSFYIHTYLSRKVFSQILKKIFGLSKKIWTLESSLLVYGQFWGFRPFLKRSLTWLTQLKVCGGSMYSRVTTILETLDYQKAYQTT